MTRAAWIALLIAVAGLFAETEHALFLAHYFYVCAIIMVIGYDG